MCSRSDDPSEHDQEERLRLEMIEAQLDHAIATARLRLAMILRDIYGTPEERARARGLLRSDER